MEHLCMYSTLEHMAFGAAKAVLFIEVSSPQGVLIREIPLYILISVRELIGGT